ncbi:MAG: PepSY domain-containing protein [Novosphingobium sp.]
MLKPVLFLHRWLGVVIGLLMTIWCLSGFVMMYVDYPRLSPAERLQGLEPLQLPTAATFERLDLPADAALTSTRIEMLAGHPVMRITPSFSFEQPVSEIPAIPSIIDLRSGTELPMLSQSDIGAVAASFGRQSHLTGAVSHLAETPIDQWSLQVYQRNAPLFRADFDDAAGTQIYISGAHGEVVQQTTRFERFWGWLGAVPHWLYPTMLRQNGPLWSQVVIWTSLAGCFLTATGLWTGVARLKRQRDGKIASPYRGLWWWHHVFGLFFGILTLTWVASGLFSVHPWGFLDSMAGFDERQKLSGDLDWGEVQKGLVALRSLPHDTVQIETAPLAGRLYFLATDRSGKSVRYDANGRVSILGERELRAALRPLHASRLERLTHEDSYYYAHKFPVLLPVWRARLDDPGQTLLYINPVSGQLNRAVDRNGRGFRWLQEGLHSLDFPILRSRPLWDLVVVPLLAMVTAVCATGTWMAWNKTRRDVRIFARRRRRKRATA